MRIGVEQDLFMERMKEVGVDGNWGVFSMTIPGASSLVNIF